MQLCRVTNIWIIYNSKLRRIVSQKFKGLTSLWGSFRSLVKKICHLWVPKIGGALSPILPSPMIPNKQRRWFFLFFTRLYNKLNNKFLIWGFTKLIRINFFNTKISKAALLTKIEWIQLHNISQFDWQNCLSLRGKQKKQGRIYYWERENT